MTQRIYLVVNPAGSGAIPFDSTLAIVEYYRSGSRPLIRSGEGTRLVEAFDGGATTHTLMIDPEQLDAEHPGYFEVRMLEIRSSLKPPPRLTDAQRLVVHLTRSLTLCDHMGDVADDIDSLWKALGLGAITITGEDDGVHPLDRCDAMLGCEGGLRSDDFQQLATVLGTP